MFNSIHSVQSFPSNRLNRSTSYITMYDTAILPYNKMYDGCTNTLCYTYSKNYIYKPHTAYGMVGRTSTGYLHQRKRL